MELISCEFLENLTTEKGAFFRLMWHSVRLPHPRPEFPLPSPFVHRAMPSSLSGTRSMSFMDTSTIMDEIWILKLPPFTKNMFWIWMKQPGEADHAQILQLNRGELKNTEAEAFAMRYCIHIHWRIVERAHRLLSLQTWKSIGMAVHFSATWKKLFYILTRNALFTGLWRREQPSVWAS